MLPAGQGAPRSWQERHGGRGQEGAHPSKGAQHSLFAACTIYCCGMHSLHAEGSAAELEPPALTVTCMTCPGLQLTASFAQQFIGKCSSHEPIPDNMENTAHCRCRWLWWLAPNASSCISTSCQCPCCIFRSLLDAQEGCSAGTNAAMHPCKAVSTSHASLLMAYIYIYH